MIFYSAYERGFFFSNIHGKNIPSDAVVVSKELHHYLMSEQASEKLIVPDGKGFPISVDPPQTDAVKLLENFKISLRSLRDIFLSRVADIGTAAFAMNATSLSNEVFSDPGGVRRKLLDITDDPALNSATTLEEMEAAVLAYYEGIVANVSPELRGAFKELEKK